MGFHACQAGRAEHAGGLECMEDQDVTCWNAGCSVSGRGDEVVTKDKL